MSSATFTLIVLLDDPCAHLKFVELYGTSVMSSGHIGFFQGESGYFECTTREATFLQWNVGDDPALPFSIGDPIGHELAGSLATAYLIERDVNTERRGNRTSILRVTPDPNFTGYINITCDSVRGDNVCTITAEVVGKYNV